MILHWHDEELPEDHPLAYSEINCKKCKRMVHFANNEWISSWVEDCHGVPFGKEEDSDEEEGIYEGIYCFSCLIDVTLRKKMDD